MPPQEEADLVLLAGDLTTHGEPEQAAVLADAGRGLSIPVCAILGNYDLHEGRADEVAAILRDAGVNMLERAAAFYELGGTEVGVVGAKGFVGGFPGSSLPDFGEPLLRQVYAETTVEVNAIERGLQETAHCPLRIVLLHYADLGHAARRAGGDLDVPRLRPPCGADRGVPPRHRAARPRARRQLRGCDRPGAGVQRRRPRDWPGLLRLRARPTRGRDDGLGFGRGDRLADLDRAGGVHARRGAEDL
jgi:hypothetical protein